MKKILTPQQNLEIIDKYKTGISSGDLAIEYKVHRNTILKVLKRANQERRHGSQFTIQDIQKMQNLYNTGLSLIEVGKQFNITGSAVRQIFLKHNIIRRTIKETRKHINIDFFEIININGMLLTKNNIKNLSKEEREKLAEDLFKYIRKIGFNYYTNANLKQEYNRLINSKLEIKDGFINGHNSVASKLCKFYCKDFYKSIFKNELSIWQAFHDDKLLLGVIKNRLNLDPRNNEFFSISFFSLLRGFTSSYVCYNISIFKPLVAKTIYEKYSNPGETVLDYSAGWGGRMLGAAACGRKYIGIDPLTIPSLNEMKKDLNIMDVTLIQNGSENVQLAENTIDFAFSSPPYYNLEKYSNDLTQAYNKNESYFYDIYWRNTLKNIKLALKSNKYFGLNIQNVPKMLEITKEYFGEPVEELKMVMSISHLRKKIMGKNIKYEPIYIFKNIK